MVDTGAARIGPAIRSLCRPISLVVAILAGHVPAAAELTATTENGFVSRHELVVEASPTQTWLALISPAGWWRPDHTWSGDAANLTLTPQAGGCFCETIPEVDEPGKFSLQGSVEHMRVIQAYPERALRMQGALGPLQSEPVIGILTIALSKAGKGTRIVWEYNVGGSMRYEVPVIAKAVDAVMGQQMAALGKLLGPAAMPTGKPATKGESAIEADDDGANGATAPGVPVPKVEPLLKVTPAPVASSAPKPTAAPVIKPSTPSTSTSTPPSTPVAKPVVPAPARPIPKPVAKPATVPATVGDAFADLERDPQA